MGNLYAEGTFLTAKTDPAWKLLIKRYLGRIYYCAAVYDPSQKLWPILNGNIPPRQQQLNTFV